MLFHSRVMVVDADESRARALLELLAPAGHDAWRAPHADASSSPADVVLFSVDTADLVAAARQAAAVPDADIVLLVTASPDERARAAAAAQACEVVERASGPDAVLAAVERAARWSRDRRELAMLRARLGDEARGALVGSSPGMAIAREILGRAAASRRTMCVTGEAGTGKSTVARLVHDLSERAASPFVVASCEGVTAQALEVQLFGGARGGLLEAARGGTLVLDEAAALPRSALSRLTAALAERVVRRAADDSGGRAPDVRLVLTARTPAANSAGATGEPFHEGNTVSIVLPPLRDRRRDIPQLVQHFRERIGRERGIAVPPVAADTMSSLLAHHWPGNVRELELRMERIALHEQGSDASADFRTAVAPGADFAPLDAAHLTLAALERRYILHVLAQEGGHQSRAADRLGIDRRTLYRKLKEYRDDDASARIAG
jgi:DNA-binding NtrC family response regulator